MALEDQLAVHVADGHRVHPFELDGGKLAPGNRDGPKYVPDDHGVAVSIEAPPEARTATTTDTAAKEQKE
jgi:hypothetical protein